ncbi:MAG: response regulator [Faecalibacterium sp.]|jgi:CheY-like chemotaxis protein|nr:response regulator [Faecalibacterium sp.]
MEAQDTQLHFTRRVLLVEDQEVNLRIVTHLLNQRGVQADTATSGRRAVERFALSQPYYYDLILTDIMMPDGSGVEEAVEIRKMDRPDAHTIPIIALTAASGAEMACYGDAGIDDVLPKPVQPAMMDVILNKWAPVAAPHGRILVGDSNEEIEQKLPEFKTLDARQALRYADGDITLCLDAMKEYCASLPERVAAIHEAVVRRDYQSYALECHKLRSATATAGAADVAREAAKLEAAGKAGDVVAILRGTQHFLSELNAQYVELAAVLHVPNEAEESTDRPQYQMRTEHLQKELALLLAQLRAGRDDEAEKLLGELLTWQHEKADKELLYTLRQDMRCMNYQTAATMLQQYLQREKQQTLPQPTQTAAQTPAQQAQPQASAQPEAPARPADGAQEKIEKAED